ncbi:hypothetical protein PF011_g22284 [Phytophthora fragariae]|uniref:Sugar phosphate phosphatase n=1 Tax=Phytophthora fragariae TaxID=53985 RepID=A0A6A3IES0_9STRA|nr:hypothetical protein PF011_g22284 [Phytophthora fragariae]
MEFASPSSRGSDCSNWTGEWWHNAPWFLAGMYMFHLILLITDYYTTGIDPFHASKVAELEQETPWRLLQTAVGLSAQEEASSQSRHDQLKRFMKLYHSDRVISFLEKKAGESGDEKSVAVQYINDNSGTELLLDLALADHLLTHGWCGKVTLNVKMEPMYVSDAIGADVHEHIAEMQRESRTPEVQALGKRLAGYVSDELLVVRPDIFWNRYTFYWEMPTELYTRLEQEATLMIIKGDLNYRRLLGDRLWSPSTPIEEVVPYFPTAFVSLRTMKSTLVAGIPAHIVEKLEKEDSKWKFNGKRAIIQSVLEPQ